MSEAQKNNSIKNSSINSITASEEPQTQLTADQVMDQISAIRTSIPKVTPLTQKQRRLAVGSIVATPDVLAAQMEFVSKSEVISTAVGVDAGGAKQLMDDDARWKAVELALRALLGEVVDANVLRRQKVHAVASQAYNVGISLSRTELNSALGKDVVEVRRLKRLAKRKKTSAETPSPQPGVSEHSTGM